MRTGGVAKVWTAVLGALAGLCVLGAAPTAVDGAKPQPVTDAPPAPEADGHGRLAVMVLGDSDSHSYHDDQGDLVRGGRFAAVTYNWLEAWARLRPQEIDPGAYRVAGDRRMAARMKTLLGRPTRTPRKRDFDYNFAFSGAQCASLTEQWPQQAEQARMRLQMEPGPWRRGVVFIRIGINDFGQAHHLTAWVRDPDAGLARVADCLAAIRSAVAALRAASDAPIVLVGVAREFELPLPAFEGWSAAEASQAERVLAAFDDGLAAIAREGRRILFVDDHAWFRRRFGSRLSGDLQDAARIADIAVFNALSDDPHSLHLADRHAGTIAGGLFAQSVVPRLNAAWGLGLTDLSDAEIVALTIGAAARGATP